MNLGQMRQALKTQCYRQTVHRIRNLHSYRGFYDRAAFEPAESYDNGTTTDDLIAQIDEALSGKIFYGWKGGEFVFNEYTPVYLSEIGSASGIAIVKIYDTTEGYPVIQTADVTDYE